MKKTPKVAVVLGGGGALGFAHIGVLEVLEKHHIPVDIVVGTSMGALIGGAYCSGKSTSELEQMAIGITKRTLFDLSLGFQGLLSGKKVVKILREITNDINIENSKPRFACNAVDLSHGVEHVFTTGNMVEAMRASMSVPGIFTCPKINNVMYADGGLLNNCADDLGRELGGDIVIAIDVVSNSVLNENIKSMVGAVIQSFLILQKELQSLKNDNYDVLIQPNLQQHKQYTFKEESTLDIIQKGREATELAIPQILKLLKKRHIRRHAPTQRYLVKPKKVKRTNTDK